jgi:hypothetical protein
MDYLLFFVFFTKDEPSVFAEKSNIKMVGFDLIRRISERLYSKTGVGPDQVQVNWKFGYGHNFFFL